MEMNLPAGYPAFPVQNLQQTKFQRQQQVTDTGTQTHKDTDTQRHRSTHTEARPYGLMRMSVHVTTHAFMH